MASCANMYSTYAWKLAGCAVHLDSTACRHRRCRDASGGVGDSRTDARVDFFLYLPQGGCQWHR